MKFVNKNFYGTVDDDDDDDGEEEEEHAEG